MSPVCGQLCCPLVSQPTNWLLVQRNEGRKKIIEKDYILSFPLSRDFLCSILPRLRRRQAFWRLLLLCIRYFLAFRESTGFLPAPTTTTTFTEVEEGKCSSLGRGEGGIGRNSKALPIIQLILQTFPPISWECGWKIVGESFFQHYIMAQCFSKVKTPSQKLEINHVSNALLTWWSKNLLQLQKQLAKGRRLLESFHQ